MRKSKKDRNGLTPVYLRVTVDGKRAEISKNRKIDPSTWDQEAYCVKGNSDEVRIMNPLHFAGVVTGNNLSQKGTKQVSDNTKLKQRCQTLYLQ